MSTRFGRKTLAQLKAEAQVKRNERTGTDTTISDRFGAFPWDKLAQQNAETKKGERS